MCDTRLVYAAFPPNIKCRKQNRCNSTHAFIWALSSSLCFKTFNVNVKKFKLCKIFTLSYFLDFSPFWTLTHAEYNTLGGRRFLPSSTYLHSLLGSVAVIDRGETVCPSHPQSTWQSHVTVCVPVDKEAAHWCKQQLCHWSSFMLLQTKWQHHTLKATPSGGEMFHHSPLSFSCVKVLPCHFRLLTKNWNLTKSCCVTGCTANKVKNLEISSHTLTERKKKQVDRSGEPTGEENNLHHNLWKACTSLKHSIPLQVRGLF